MTVVNFCQLKKCDKINLELLPLLSTLAQLGCNRVMVQTLSVRLLSCVAFPWGGDECWPCCAEDWENYLPQYWGIHLTFRIGLFLVSLAIENLLKGLWVGRNYKRIKKINNMRKDLPELTTHKLGDVAKAAAMKLSSQEESLLSDLSKIIVWYGRYPAPLKVDEYGVQFQTGPPSNRFMAGPTIFSMELPFPTELDHFIARVKELQTIPKENYV